MLLCFCLYDFFLWLFLFLFFFFRKLYFYMWQFNNNKFYFMILFLYFLKNSLYLYSCRRIFSSMLPHFKIKMLSNLDILILHMPLYEIPDGFYGPGGPLVIRSL